MRKERRQPTKTIKVTQIRQMLLCTHHLPVSQAKKLKTKVRLIQQWQQGTTTTNCKELEVSRKQT